jgi:hypothetical protein
MAGQKQRCWELMGHRARVFFDFDFADIIYCNHTSLSYSGPELV